MGKYMQQDEFERIAGRLTRDLRNVLVDNEKAIAEAHQNDWKIEIEVNLAISMPEGLLQQLEQEAAREAEERFFESLPVDMRLRIRKSLAERGSLTQEEIDEIKAAQGDRESSS